MLQHFSLHYLIRVTALVTTTLFTLMHNTQLLADDVDIICSVQSTPDPVLFILDDSSSMQYNNLSGNITFTREAALKNVFEQYMQSRKDGEIGLMWFRNAWQNNASLGGGYVAYPVTDITALPYAPDGVQNPRESVGAEITHLTNSNVPYGGTPIVDSLYEAILYLTGRQVDFGQYRQGQERDRVSHPAAYTNGTSTKPSCWNSSAPYCADEKIVGNPSYISPFKAGDSVINIVLLSDGEATVNKSTSRIASLIGNNNCHSDATTPGEQCGRSLAQWLKGRDLMPDLSGKQEVVVHTIAFDLNQNKARQFLTDLADLTGGQALTVNTMNELDIAFRTIITGPTTPKAGPVHSFTRPALSIDPLDRTRHSDDIYFSVFNPGDNGPWKGNLKRYQLQGNPRQIMDAKGNLAINKDNGQFAANSRSFWSKVDDGDQAHLGGAAEQLSDPDSRNAYTEGTNSYPMDLTSAANALSKDNLEKLAENMGDNVSAELASASIDWARGKTNPNFIGDPLHSSPTIVTYKYDPSGEKPDEKVAFFGTNQGYLHAIDTRTGEEIFAFMPKALLPNLPHFQAGTAVIDNQRLYGLDGSPVAWVRNDKPFNDLSGSDQVMVYIGMRRGGRNYYALDVTNPKQPKLKWKISGGQDNGNFENLGQTWSTPIKTKVRVADGSSLGTVKDVLMFAGGYDPQQDKATSKTEDTIGNAIFMVDANTGELIWKASKSVPSNIGLSLLDMRYSIPADLTVVDYDKDGEADYFFAGDMGGQVWRFDIDPNNSPQQLVRGGVIARIGDNTTKHHRRFFNAPDVSIVNHKDELRLSIAIGSGDRSAPLSTAVADRFYVFFVDDPFGVSQEAYTTQTEAHWTDRTNQTNSTVNDGWYIGFDSESGEKVLASSVTLNNIVIFTSFKPSIENNQPTCEDSGTMGTNRLWALNIADAAGSVDLNNDGQINKNSDRTTSLNSTSLIPQPQLVFSDKTISITTGPITITPNLNATLRATQAEPFFFQDL